jgi:hypothetical protein
MRESNTSTYAKEAKVEMDTKKYVKKILNVNRKISSIGVNESRMENDYSKIFKNAENFQKSTKQSRSGTKSVERGKMGMNDN